jgi:spindle assembly abnormal protein 6
MIDLQRESPYFEQVLPIQVSNGPDDMKTLNLSFRIIPGFKQSKQSGQNEKVIHFEFADENDPYFLYLLDVSEQDFHQLRRDQSILVEFLVFPSKLIELLDQCKSIISADLNPNNSHQSQFSLRLDQSTGVFSIVETNMFKQLTHISLMLRPGNDANIKAYLASRLNFTMSVSKCLRHDLEEAMNSLSSELVIRRQLSSELQEIKYVVIFN